MSLISHLGLSFNCMSFYINSVFSSLNILTDILTDHIVHLHSYVISKKTNLQFVNSAFDNPHNNNMSYDVIK